MDSLIRACNGEKRIVECNYMYISGIPGGDLLKEKIGGLDYFAAKMELGVKHTPFGGTHGS